METGGVLGVLITGHIGIGSRGEDVSPCRRRVETLRFLPEKSPHELEAYGKVVRKVLASDGGGLNGRHADCLIAFLEFTQEALRRVDVGQSRGFITYDLLISAPVAASSQAGRSRRRNGNFTKRTVFISLGMERQSVGYKVRRLKCEVAAFVEILILPSGPDSIACSNIEDGAGSVSGCVDRQ